MMGFDGFGLLFLLFFFIPVNGIAVALVSYLFPRTTSLTDGYLPTPGCRRYSPAITEYSAQEILN